MAFSFPILKKKEILSCLTGLGIPLTLEQLQKPDDKIMKLIYERFVEVLMGITKDELRQPAFIAMDQLPYPELHEESITEITLQKSFLQLVRAVGISDISLRDLMMPTEKRLITLLSGLINFAKFREERLCVYQELNKQTEQIMELRQQLAFENETLQNTCKQLTLQRESESDALRELIAELSTLEARLHTTNTQHLQQHDALKLVKEKSQAIQDGLDSDKFVILNLKQECDKLRSAIVKSPETLKQSITDMSQSIETNKSELSDISSKLRELQSKHQHLTRIDTQIKGMCDIMHEIITIRGTYHQVKKQEEDMQNNIILHEDKIRAQQQTEAHLKKQLTIAQEKMVKLQMLFQTKKATAQATLDQMVREKHLYSSTLAAEKTKLDHHEAEYSVKKQELDEMIQIHQMEMTNMRNLYGKFEETLRNYHQRLLAEMTATVNANPHTISTSLPLSISDTTDSPRQQQSLEDAMNTLNMSINTSLIAV